MHNKIEREKMVMDVCMRFAATQTKSKKATDILNTLVKLAQSGDMWSKMLELPESRIKDILGDNTPYENKKESLRKIINDSLNVLATYAIEKANTPGIEDQVSRYMSTKFVDWMLDKKLPEYNGPAARNFQIKGILHGLLNTASRVDNQEQNLSYDARQKAKTQSTDTQSVDKNGEIYNGEITNLAPSAHDVLVEQSETPVEDNKIQAMEKIFYDILKNPEQDIMSLYVEGDLLPKFTALKDKLNVTQGPDRAKVEADFDEFCDKTTEYIRKNISERKVIPGAGGNDVKMDFSLQEIQGIVNQAVNNMDLDNLVKSIIASKHYKLPRAFAKILQSEPELVEASLKALIKSSIIMTTKDEMRVSLPEAKNRKETQGGRNKLPHIELMYHILNKNIRNITKEPERLQKLLSEALQMLGSRKDINGQVTHKPKDMTNYAFFQHSTPLVMSGLMHQAEEMYGEAFTNLPEDKKHEIINAMHEKIYPHLPHTYDEGKAELSRINYGKLENPEYITKKHLLDRLHASQEIARGNKKPGKMMHDFVPMEPEVADENIAPNPNLSKESKLNILIQKYASRY